MAPLSDIMGSSERRTVEDDGEPSPLSSPPGQQTPSSLMPPPGPANRSRESLSLRTTDDTGFSQKRQSLDASSLEYDYISRSPLLEHEHGLGPSGLQRIRQAPTLPNTSNSTFTSPIASIASQSVASSRSPSMHFSTDRSTPGLEDLHRFPSESLHSFSFAQQSEEFLHNRQNVLKRSIDFMKDRFGFAASNVHLANAQARLSGDAEIQSMMELVSKANLLDRGENQPVNSGLAGGPLTGPPDMEGANIFEKAFATTGSLSRTTGETSSRNGPASPRQILEESQYLSPIADDHITPQKRGMKSVPSSRRVSLKRTYTDLGSVALQNKLTEALAQPYSAGETLSHGGILYGLGGGGASSVHTHSSKWFPVSQAVFTTGSTAPWTILAANDLACLGFGVTEADIKKLSILNLVQKERRQWLESKLRKPSLDNIGKPDSPDKLKINTVNTASLGMGNGVTAQLLSKSPSNATNARRAKTEDGSGSTPYGQRSAKKMNHSSNKSRGVLLCGDVVPILKRNGVTGSASVWVIEKRGGLIWVLEEIVENTVHLRFDDGGRLLESQGDIEPIWGANMLKSGIHITDIIPNVPRPQQENFGEDVFRRIVELKYFTALTRNQASIPITITELSSPHHLRISHFPHVAGIVVLSATTLDVISANSVFSAALFGQEHLKDLKVTDLIPYFDEYLNILTEEDDVSLVDGMVIPEHSFRRARALLVIRDGKTKAASLFSRPSGLPSRHRDGAEIMVDVQLRVVKSETIFPANSTSDISEHSTVDDENGAPVAVTEVVYALWITYSRQLHSSMQEKNQQLQPLSARSPSLPPQLSPGQRSPTLPAIEPPRVDSPFIENQAQLSLLSRQLNEAASEPLTDKPVQPVPEVRSAATKKEMPKKKSISEYVILEEMGQGAYGQVKLARCKRNPASKVVLKYVTKKRILVDTWTRDRRLGTVPLEIHVLDYLRRDGLRHPNIVEMKGFFEDDTNYYIEMVPHGLPGMDLFDYIELRSKMDEDECRNIFYQVVDAIHHLHTKAHVVHRDIKDENVILDGEGRIKLIDFGSAAYISKGPFDVFVGTIDYAAPEVLQGKSYGGKEQDVWALGILLYTIVYKENPFYNIDEILDHPLRVPYLPFSEECIDLIRQMLDRDVDQRLTIEGVMQHPWMMPASLATAVATKVEDGPTVVK
ncbi:CAMK/CAMKL/PASK protein kinase [Blastomyces gilchristii SLH14081]|uniref:non-specific serine/threonine protein kinase n=1 Tax=Blastomyces gilchristii (strain SLH14081) TaxID=559298 RepID=A0A179UNQ2_BLAGS|nr:CAMK/CAMKL/PASK protein kinase [Blastomyces gilchristii SLH14081]OAT08727.1 CAMK/CAMKL/PASK protein kinase [Blastomyces gilchristii SLH14081]